MIMSIFRGIKEFLFDFSVFVARNYFSYEIENERIFIFSAYSRMQVSG